MIAKFGYGFEDLIIHYNLTERIKRTVSFKRSLNIS